MGPRVTFELDWTIGLARIAKNHDFCRFCSSDAKELKWVNQTSTKSINNQFPITKNSSYWLVQQIQGQSNGNWPLKNTENAPRVECSFQVAPLKNDNFSYLTKKDSDHYKFIWETSNTQNNFKNENLDPGISSLNSIQEVSEGDLNR